MLDIVIYAAAGIVSVTAAYNIIAKRKQIGAGIASLFDRYTAWGKFWLLLGMVLLAAAAAMSFDFGWGVSTKHALFLAGMSFVTAFLPDAAYEKWNAKSYGASLALALCSLPLFGLEFFSHAGYTAGLRGINISDTNVQNTKWSAAQHAAGEEKAAYDMMAKRFADLNAQNGWAGTVTADAERAKLPGLQLAIENESKRGGCKTLCEVKTKDRDAVNARIAILEERTDLQKKLEAARAYLDKRRDRAAAVEHKSSAVEHQNAFLTKAVALTVNGTLEATPVQAEKVQQAVNLGMALAGTGLPALCFFAAGLYRRKEDEHTAPIKTAGLHVLTKTIDHTDHAMREHLHALAKSLKAA